MSSTERKVCSKCGRTKIVDEFFSYKSGEKCEMCKDCLLEHVDNSDPDTFLWILEKFDVPYVERLWVETANKEYAKNPGAFGPKSVFGKYMRNMKMAQYKNYTWADSEALNATNASKPTPEMEASLKARLDAGEITQAQYDTLSGTAKSKSAGEARKLYTEKFEIQRSIDESLTDDDRKYLMNKWGTAYTSDEWLRMEDLYTRYAAEYDMNVDREETLKKICKTSVKMDEALDSDNMLDYKNLSQVLDSLRKSGRFTEAQNKEDKTGMVDSIGQLVQLCERDGGIIEQFPDPEDYPRDKIDLTINDFKQYAVNLLRNEPNISGLIESYVAKLEEADSKTQRLLDSVSNGSKNLDDPFGYSSLDDEEEPFTDEDAQRIKAMMGLV